MHVPDTELVGLAITRIRVASNASSGYTDDHTQHLRSLQNRWKSNLIEPYIKDRTGVGAALTSGLPVYDRNVPSWAQNIEQREIDIQYKNLTKKIKRRIDAL